MWWIGLTFWCPALVYNPFGYVVGWPGDWKTIPALLGFLRVERWAHGGRSCVDQRVMGQVPWARLTDLLNKIYDGLPVRHWSAETRHQSWGNATLAVFPVGQPRAFSSKTNVKTVSQSNCKVSFFVCLLKNSLVPNKNTILEISKYNSCSS